MLSDTKYETEFDELVEQLRSATELTLTLIRHVVTNICTRLPVLKNAGKAPNIERLIEVGALCDTAFALIAIELPAWSVRRLVHENGEWFCSLTRQPNLSVALDDTADATHQALPVASTRLQSLELS